MLLLSLLISLAIEKEDPPRTIVLIVAHGAFFEDFGFAGNRAAHTPTLDGLARTGALFPHTYLTMSRARPSMLSITTGQIFPAYERVETTDEKSDEATLPSLPRILGERQYLTWVGGKYFEPVRGIRNFSQGYTKPDDLVRNHDGGLKKFLRTAAGRDVFVWWAPKLPYPISEAPQDLFVSINPSELKIPSYISEQEREAWKEKNINTSDGGMARPGDLRVIPDP